MREKFENCATPKLQNLDSKSCALESTGANYKPRIQPDRWAAVNYTSRPYTVSGLEKISEVGWENMDKTERLEHKKYLTCYEKDFPAKRPQPEEQKFRYAFDLSILSHHAFSPKLSQDRWMLKIQTN